MSKQMKTHGVFLCLVAQLDKLARHNRQGSYSTRARYYEALKRFCIYLAVVYHLQKLENISGKHLVSYVLELQAQGKSASTIKTDLAAIRASRLGQGGHGASVGQAPAAMCGSWRKTAF